MPARPHEEVATPTQRPSSLEEMFESSWLVRIKKWMADAKQYELDGRKAGGRGVKRPADVEVPEEALRPQFRGHCWYFVDYLRSGGKMPIVTVNEAMWTAGQISPEAARSFGDLYGDDSVTDRLIAGHRDMSSAEKVTLLSVNHGGALKHWQALEKAFNDESNPEVGWLLGPLDFLPCFPTRVEPCNGVAQGSKVRVTTDKSWPKPGMTAVKSVNDGINLKELGQARFCRVVDFTRAAAMLRQISCIS